MCRIANWAIMNNLMIIPVNLAMLDVPVAPDLL